MSFVRLDREYPPTPLADARALSAELAVGHCHQALDLPGVRREPGLGCQQPLDLRTGKTHDREEKERAGEAGAKPATGKDLADESQA